MRIASAEERAMVAQFGLRPMPNDRALAILGGLLADPNRNQIAIASVDWHMLKAAYEARRPRPFLRLVGGSMEVKAPPKPAQADRRDLIQGYRQAQPHERRDVVVNHVCIQVARALGLDPAYPLDVRQGLFEMGMDSLMSIDLKGRLEASVGRSLPSTLTFNYPNVEALAEYLISEILVPQMVAERATPTDERLTRRPPATQDDERRSASPAPAPGRSADLSEDQLAQMLAAKLTQVR
jgi:acyl carrier protein